MNANKTEDLLLPFHHTTRISINQISQVRETLLMVYLLIFESWPACMICMKSSNLHGTNKHDLPYSYGKKCSNFQARNLIHLWIASFIELARIFITLELGISYTELLELRPSDGFMTMNHILVKGSATAEGIQRKQKLSLTCRVSIRTSPTRYTTR